ncbi:MAG: response regulator [Verrucomicrobia bacterium]|nr:response regulator [Verrucomicrobiota bacterium]
MRRLLFVDDDDDDFKLWGRPLGTDYGWDVIHAAGPNEAKEQLQQAEKAGSLFDVVIVDRRMPDPSTGELRNDVGDEFLKDVTARWRYVCPIMLTNHGGEEPAQEATRHGAFRYLMKGTEVRTLDRVCRKGMQMQLCKRIRHSLLYSGSLDELLSEVKSRIGDMLAPHGYCVAYLEFAPGGALLIGDCECKDALGGPLASALQTGQAFLAGFPNAERTKETGRCHLSTKRDDIIRSEGVLLDSPGSQLIVPVFEPEDLHAPHATRVLALMWIESTTEAAFDEEDGEMLSALADFVGIAFARAKRLAQQGAESSDAERNSLLSEIAHRICNPLQIAQSNIDLLAERLRRNDELKSVDLLSRLEPALASIVQAIQATEQLRQSTLPRQITLRPMSLALLVQEIADSFEARAKSSSCEIQIDIASVIPKLKLDRAEMRYVLNCILENAIEAIQRKRVESQGEPQLGRIRVVLCTDPNASQSVLLSVQDNGCGISPENLPRIFERHFSTKEQDFCRGEHGLGLRAAKRLVEVANGVIQARSDPTGGTIVQVILPACDDHTAPVEVTL